MLTILIIIIFAYIATGLIKNLIIIFDFFMSKYDEEEVEVKTKCKLEEKSKRS